MKCLTKEALWPYDEKCWSALYGFCRDHGKTLSRPVVKVHANTDFVGCFTDELVKQSTTERCSYGFLFGKTFALRQATDNEASWEVIKDYLGKEEVVVQIKSWDDLAGAVDVDQMLATAIKAAKAEARARRDAFLASLPDPEPKPEPKPNRTSKFKLIDENVDHDLIDWSDYDEDDDWDDSYFG